MILAIDPGPTTCGVCLYDEEARRVVWSQSDRPVEMALSDIRDAYSRGLRTVVAIERVQSYGIAGASLLRTSEVVGRLWQEAEGGGLEVVLLPRADVLRALDLLGAKGNRDAVIHQRMLEMHGGSREVAVGKKKAPGPLYGVTGHAWSALAVAVGAAMRPGLAPRGPRR